MITRDISARYEFPPLATLFAYAFRLYGPLTDLGNLPGEEMVREAAFAEGGRFFRERRGPAIDLNTTRTEHLSIRNYLFCSSTAQSQSGTYREIELRPAWSVEPVTAEGIPSEATRR